MEQPNQNKDKRKDRKQVQVIIISLSLIIITTTFKTNRVMVALTVETDIISSSQRVPIVTSWDASDVVYDIETYKTNVNSNICDMMCLISHALIIFSIRIGLFILRIAVLET